MLVARAGTELNFYATDLSQPYRIDPPWAIDRDSTLELLLFDTPLSELGLVAGEVGQDPSGLPVPTPDATFMSQLQDGEAAGWADAQPSLEVVTARIVRDPRSLCARFYRRKVIETGALRDNAFSLKLGPAAALVGSLDGVVTYVEGDQAQSVAFPSELPFGSAVIDQAGDVWFGGDLGALWRGRFSATPTPTITAEWVATSSSGQAIRWLVVGPGANPEVFTLGIDGAFEHYRGGVFERLHDFAGPMGTKGGLASPGAGVIYAGNSRGAELLRYEGGRLSNVTPPDLLDGFTEVDFVPGFGVMVAAGQGRLFQELAVGQWRELSDPTISLFINALLPYEEGFLISGALGFMAQYRSATDSFCPAEQLGAGTSRTILVHGEDLLMAEDVPISRDRAIITLLSRR